MSCRLSRIRSKDFAPRVGFAYNLDGDGKTVIRGGFGIYYSQIVDNSEANYALTGPTGVFNYTASPGQIGFPTSVAAVPLPAFPAGAQAPLRSLYIRPGDSSLPESVFPDSTSVGLPERAAESLFRAVDIRRGAPACAGLGAERGLRRLAHAAHQSPAGCRSADAVHSHCAGADAHCTGGQLHAALLDLRGMRSAGQTCNTSDGHQSSAAV